MTSEDTPATMRAPELTLIVAATKSMGIGRAGTLPWTGLKKEMAYFARVTKRVSDKADSNKPDGAAPLKNAVIMGRKTWDSIPEKFRPLKGRLNVVLSSAYSGKETSDVKVNDQEAASFVSLSSALDRLGKTSGVDRLFIIGGAVLYKAALQDKHARRILLTRVLSDFDCDTFFPLDLGEAGNGEWKKKSKEDLDRWAGETVSEGVQEENGVKYIFEMYER